MRHISFTAAAAALALILSPSVSARQDIGSSSEEEMVAMAEKLSSEDMQNNIAGMVERMTGVVLNLPVGKFVSAIEDARPGTVKNDIPEDATLADLAGEDGNNMPETMGEQSRIAMNMMSGFAKAFAGIMPEFEKLAREMEEDMKN